MSGCHVRARWLDCEFAPDDSRWPAQMIGVDGVAASLEPAWSTACRPSIPTACGWPSSTRATGDPVLLIHGFASSVRTNWIEPGWVSLLTGRGFRVVAFDNRGHGESEKLYDRALYSAPLMAEDARRLMDHLGIPRADVMGYSMGARIAAFLALDTSRARAQRHLRRARRQHGAADGRHGPDRPRARGGQHRRREEPDGAHLPRLRREDRRRPRGAGGLHPRLARADHARDGGAAWPARCWWPPAPRT